MSAITLEERVATVERELAQIKQSLQLETTRQPIPWWESIFGTFVNSEAHEEATRLGREYRESLRPKGDEEMD